MHTYIHIFCIFVHSTFEFGGPLAPTKGQSVPGPGLEKRLHPQDLGRLVT